MDLNEQQWRAGMNFRIDGSAGPAFEASLAAAQARRRELTTRGVHAVVSRITETGEAFPLHV